MSRLLLNAFWEESGKKGGMVVFHDWREMVVFKRVHGEMVVFEGVEEVMFIDLQTRP